MQINSRIKGESRSKKHTKANDREGDAGASRADWPEGDLGGWELSLDSQKR